MRQHSLNLGRLLPGLIVILAGSVLAMGTAIASANGGNSANAKLCQMDGWMTQVQGDGTAFGTQGDCVSYGARGGTLYAKPSLQLTTDFILSCFGGPGPSPSPCCGVLDGCWGLVNGTGLTPGAEVDVCLVIDFPTTPPFRGPVTECTSDGHADGAGNFQDADGLISCRAQRLVPLASVFMESKTSYGSTIDSNVVSLPFPCP